MEKNSAVDRNASPEAVQVMIFGSGACAQKIRANLAEQGIAARLAVGAHLDRCRGFTGNFQLRLTRNHQEETTTVPAIVVAEERQASPNLAAYGLTPGPNVMAISALEADLDRPAPSDPLAAGATIVFLCGWQTDSHPTVAQRMLERCFQLQAQAGVRTVFMTGNLKVAPDGTEALVQAAKQAGTLFFKFTRDFPTVQPAENGSWTIDYRDELTRETFLLAADRLVVDECVAPKQALADLVRRLNIDRDGLGFAQSNNVRRLSNATNRRGIFVAGGSRDILSAAEQAADADQVSLRVAVFLEDRNADLLPAAVIDQGRCARCLTCHRLCPHVAIEIGDHISVVPEACQHCGICAAACPARAIDMEGVPIAADIRRRVQQPAQGDDELKPPPQIVVFGCTRSAGRAHAVASQAGHALPKGVQLIEVPCGGTVAQRHLLDAFEAGADGVMLCTCHTGNCQAETGNQVARRRAAATLDLLAAAGLEKGRLRVTSLAANMSNEWELMITAFAQDVRKLNQPPEETPNG
jgi:coenzyme F420-reducing hydrogenase delta subunit/Pyruvate/2-oxoacid:ferredoxin oxidoreductase delta subunit